MFLIISFMCGAAATMAVTAQFSDWTASLGAATLLLVGIMAGRCTVSRKVSKG